MAEHAVVTVARLDPGLVLAPERYDPRRRGAGGPVIAELAAAVSEQVSARTAAEGSRFLVLDTGDAREGIVLTRRAPVAGGELGSAKKRVRAGDVIVSRLRPYLRQVAYVDAALAPEDVEVVCSTEFHVLRSRDGDCIAFLVALLLSAPAQAVLGAAQEGGHHPRFNLATLEGIAVPEDVLARRGELSAAVERAVADARGADATMRELVRQAGGAV